MGGRINHVAVSGTYAYVNINNQLVVLDVASPKTISLVDSTNLLSADITDVDIHNHHLFVSTSDGFYTFGLADPHSPQLLDSYLIKGYERKTEFLGNYAYSVADDYLLIFDISDPKSIKQQTFRMIGSGYFEDSSPKLTIAEDRLFNIYCWSHVGTAKDETAVPDEADGAGYCAIDIYSLTDPVNPGQIGTVGVSLNYDHHFILADGNQLFSSDSSLEIFDVSDPANEMIESIVEPGIQGFTFSPGITFMAKQNQYLYLAGEQYADQAQSRSNAWFQVMDVSNPTSPTLYSAIAMPHSIHDMAIAGSYVYATDGSLQILDVSNPAAPTTIGRYSVYGEDIAESQFMIATDDHVYLAGKKLLTVDTSAPTNLAVASVYTTAGNATSLAISDTRAYLHLTNQAGDQWLRILDLNQPTITSQLGYLLPSSANDSEVVGNLLYTVDAQGFNVIDVSQPLTPTLVDTIHTAHPATALEIIGNYAYVVLADGYVVTIDLAQRQVVAGQQFNAVDIQHAGNKLILKNTIGTFNGYTKVQVLQIDNPLQPVEVTNYCIANPGAWTANNSYLFIVNGNAIEAFNFDDPSQQLPYASYPGNFSQVAAHNDQLLLTEKGQLQLFKWNAPTVPSVLPYTMSFLRWRSVVMVNTPDWINAAVWPVPTYPFTVSWAMDDLPTVYHVFEQNLEPCRRSFFDRLENIIWNSAGQKTITVTIGNIAGSLNATETVFVDNFRPITITATSGATLKECDTLSTWCPPGGYWETPLLNIPVSVVSEPTQIQYTRFVTLPHPFDNTVPNEQGSKAIGFTGYGDTPPQYETPFKLEALRNQQTLDELTFVHPFTVTRTACTISQSEIEKYDFHLRRWDGQRWVKENTDFRILLGGCPYTFKVAIKRTGEYAFFGEPIHATDWSYLPLITRN